jgi:hypothetical protein
MVDMVIALTAVEALMLWVVPPAHRQGHPGAGLSMR